MQIIIMNNEKNEIKNYVIANIYIHKIYKYNV